jgi:hypothetical protein
MNGENHVKFIKLIIQNQPQQWRFFYGKTTLPGLPSLRKFPGNGKFFVMVIYIANVSQLAILLPAREPT